MTHARLATVLAHTMTGLTALSFSATTRADAVGRCQAYANVDALPVGTLPTHGPFAGSAFPSEEQNDRGGELPNIYFENQQAYLLLDSGGVIRCPIDLEQIGPRLSLQHVGGQVVAPTRTRDGRSALVIRQARENRNIEIRIDSVQFSSEDAFVVEATYRASASSEVGSSASTVVEGRFVYDSGRGVVAQDVATVLRARGACYLSMVPEIQERLDDTSAQCESNTNGEQPTDARAGSRTADSITFATRELNVEYGRNNTLRLVGGPWTVRTTDAEGRGSESARLPAGGVNALLR